MRNKFEDMESALKVISVWAKVAMDTELMPDSVKNTLKNIQDLCNKALGGQDESNNYI